MPALPLLEQAGILGGSQALPVTGKDKALAPLPLSHGFFQGLKTRRKHSLKVSLGRDTSPASPGRLRRRPGASPRAGSGPCRRRRQRGQEGPAIVQEVTRTPLPHLLSVLNTTADHRTLQENTGCDRKTRFSKSLKKLL